MNLRLSVLLILATWVGCTPFIAAAITLIATPPKPPDDVMDLADATRERIVCGCTYWDNDADRASWIPCRDHLINLLMDVTK